MSKIPKTPQEVFPEIVEDLKKNLWRRASIDHPLWQRRPRRLCSREVRHQFPRRPCRRRSKGSRKSIADDPEMEEEGCGNASLHDEGLHLLLHRCLPGGVSQHETPLPDRIMARMCSRTSYSTGKALRLQCERELKGKLILLRTGFLNTAGKAEDLRRLMAASITAVLSVFGALLLIQSREIPKERRDIVPAVTETYGLDAAPFLRCIDLREGKKICRSGT